MNHKDNISDFLKKEKTENLFVTPKDYFDDLPIKIAERVTGRKQEIPLNFFYRLLQKPAYVISISVVILILISIFILPLTRSWNDKDFFTDLTIEELFEDPDFLMTELNEYDLIDGLISYDDVSLSSDFDDIEYYQDEIFEYLEDSDLENELIYDL